MDSRWILGGFSDAGDVLLRVPWDSLGIARDSFGILVGLERKGRRRRRRRRISLEFMGDSSMVATFLALLRILWDSWGTGHPRGIFR